MSISYPEPGLWRDDFLEDGGEQGDHFHLSQYEGTSSADPVRQLKCVKCGGVDFHIGRADYYTAVRCVACRWEVCVHEG
jgi:hypothetical protein